MAETAADRISLRIGYGLSVLASLGFGLSPSGAKLAYAGGAEPMTLVLLRFLCCVIGVAAIARLIGRPLTIARVHWPRILPLSITMVISSWAYLAAIDRIPVSLTVVIVYLFPLFVFLGSLALRETTATPARLAAFGVAFVGVVLAVGGDIRGGRLDGLVFALLAAMSIATSTLLFSRLSRRLNGLTISFWAMTGAGLITGLLVAAGTGLVFPTGGTAWAGFVMTVLSFATALVSFYLAVPRIGAVTAAMMANLEPVIAILGAVILIAERPGPQRLIGAALIIGAIIAMHWSNRRAARRALVQSGTQGS